MQPVAHGISLACAPGTWLSATIVAFSAAL
jgi:hypothetical protein